MRQRAGRIWCARVRGHGQRGPSPGLRITPRRTVTRPPCRCAGGQPPGGISRVGGDPREPALLGVAAARLVPRETLIASQARQSAGGPGLRHRPAAPWRQGPGAASGDQHGAHARQGTAAITGGAACAAPAARLRRGWRGRPAALSGPPGTRPAAAAPSAAPPCGGHGAVADASPEHPASATIRPRSSWSLHHGTSIYNLRSRARRPGTHGRLSGSQPRAVTTAGPRGHPRITPSEYCGPTAAIRRAQPLCHLRSPGAAATPEAVSALPHNQVRGQPIGPPADCTAGS